MKYLALVSFLLLSVTAISAGDLMTMFHADNNGTTNCKPAVLAMSWKAALKTIEPTIIKPTGYSKCSHVKTEDSISVKCEEPILFESITTTNMAKCNVFIKNLKKK